MDNLKIKVLSDWRDIDSVKNESIEIRSLFSDLGFDLQAKGVNYSGESFFYTLKNELRGCCAVTFSKSPNKEITLQELRDMVVLKRNDVGDANYTCDREKKYYVTGDDVYMYVVQGEWSLCKNLTLEKAIEVWGLKPIKEEVMKKSLNDKIATAEVARQEEKHSHYKKDVSHLNMIDPYRISDLYNLHPCADHIMKKSLCAGNRGHKDTLRDIQDIIDTAERWKQMIEEDNNEI